MYSSGRKILQHDYICQITIDQTYCQCWPKKEIRHLSVERCRIMLLVYTLDVTVRYSTGQICLHFFFSMRRKNNCSPPSSRRRQRSPVLHLFFQILAETTKKTEPFWVLSFLEVPARFELANESFSDSCLTTWPRYHLERVTRLELATSTLARWRSTG